MKKLTLRKLELKTLKKRWMIAALLCVFAAAAVYSVSRRSRVRGESGSRQMEATVTTGTIETSISGTGTISYANQTEIVLPSDLVVDEMLVSEGSSVTEGALLATVDEASLAACFNEIEEAISDVDSTIASESSSTSQSIKAGVAGRVKKIYADEGDSVTDTMQENEALMLISADGLMQVKLANVGNTNAGDEVEVSSGDTKTDGTVETVGIDGAVITFDDNVFDYEEEVSVTSGDGIALGKGNASIHQVIQVVGSSGTISSLNVSLDSTVSASTKVYTLDSSTKSAEYMQAVKEREQLVALLNNLVSIQSNGGITAAADGMVETINVTADSASTTSNQSSTNSGFTMSEVSETEVENTETTKVSSAETVETTDKVLADETGTSGFTSMSAMQTVTRVSSAAVTKEALPAPVSLTAEAGKIVGTTADMEYADNENAADWTECTDKSTAVAAGIWYVRYKETTEFAASSAVKVVVTEGTTDQNSTDAAASKDDSSTTEDKTNGTDSTTQNDASEKTEKPDNENSSDGAKTGSDNATNKNGSAGESSSTGGTKTGGSTSSGSTSGSSAASQTTTAVETISAFVIANGDQMKVTMNVDELDIGSMQVGLSAEITLDAMEGENFTGEITSVSGSASASNGVAQYPVEITFDKTDAMLSGMNASVAVIVEQAENVLTVPLAAVTDLGAKAYVYTGYDESSGELTGQTEVVLGLSDENNVEIQSGLSEGDTIYYQIMGSEETGENTGNGKEGFDMPGIGGSGDMPDEGKGQFKDDGSGRGGTGMSGGGPGRQQ